MARANRHWAGMLLAAVCLAIAPAARAQAVVNADATVGTPTAVSVTIPLQASIASLASRYGSTTVFNTSDPTLIVGFFLIGLTMPVTVQKLATVFPSATITVNSLSLSLTGDARFTLSAGTCASPSGSSCKATVAYNGAGPDGVATVRVRASVPSITIGGAGLLGPLASNVYPLLSGVVSNFLVVDVKVTIAPGMVPDPDNHTALWWNPLESGWGLNVNHQGDTVFATLFTYDDQGAPLWLVMSAGRQQPGGATYQGPLYRTTGPAFNAVPFTPIGPANLTEVGSMTIAFSGADEATLTYGVNGTVVTKSIRRQVFGSRVASCTTTTGAREGLTNVQDLWWNSGESGWGINLTHQDDIVFATLFTYDMTGRGLWLVMSAGLRQPDGSFAGDLYRTSGPPFGANPFTPIGPSNLTRVGTMTLRFADGNHGTLTYSVDGVTVVKDITRQVFASPVPSCS